MYVITIMKRHTVCSKKLRQFPSWMAVESSPMYFVWRECTFQLSTVNLLAAILMPYSIILFYEHSTLKLWCEILVELGKKLSFQLFCTRRLNYNIVLKLQITFNLRLSAAKNTYYIEKKLQVKVVQNWISYKKVRERVCLYHSPSPSELGD